MKYTGGCHCAKVRFEVEMEIKEVISCNCSICLKRGSLLAFTPATNFKLLSGKDSLSDYLFNKHIIHHLFCSNCGILSFADGTTPDGSAMKAINVRCLDGINLGDFKVVNFNGKDS